MPQGWVTKVERDSGFVAERRDGGGITRVFKHWALAPEMGGRWPQVGAYIQFAVRADPARGEYINDVRVLTPPQVSDGRNRNVYADTSAPAPEGIKRKADDGSWVPLEEALRREAAEAETTPGVREVAKPTAPLHESPTTDPTPVAADDPETFTMSFAIGTDGTMTETK